MGVKLGITQREDHRLRALENRVLRKMFGFDRKTVTENYVMSCFMVFVCNTLFFSCILKEDEIGGACGMHGRGEKYIQNVGWEALRTENTRQNYA